MNFYPDSWPGWKFLHQQPAKRQPLPPLHHLVCVFMLILHLQVLQSKGRLHFTRSSCFLFAMSCINFKKPTLQLFGSNTAMTLQFNKRLRLTDILMVRLFFNGIFAKHAARPIIRGCLEWKNLTQWVHRVAGKKGSIRGVRKWHSGQQKTNQPTKVVETQGEAEHTYEKHTDTNMGAKDGQVLPPGRLSIGTLPQPKPIKEKPPIPLKPGPLGSGSQKWLERFVWFCA